MKEREKHALTFKEFLENKKKEQPKNLEKQIDWEERKNKWLHSLEVLYKTIDTIIVSNLKEAGYEIITENEDIRIVEDYVGAYSVKNLIIRADNILIRIDPIGTIIIGAFGRVNMVLPKETIKLVLSDWNDWKIVTGIGNSMKLVDFNEQSILKIFQENL